MKYLDKVYGPQEGRDQLALSIIKTKEMQRLKGVNQYGALKYITPWMTTTRFEHCLGVYSLLKRLGASREEQIAGLIHDIGHTAFSHVYDYVVGRLEEQDSNDEAQAGVVINSEIRTLLLKEGIDTNFILTHKNFLLLEKELPDLCADRIDYILRDGLNYGAIQRDDIPPVLNSLKTDGKMIFLDDPSQATKLSLLFMKMDEDYYRSAVQNAAYSLLGEAMRIALDKNIISNDDFFDTDDFIINKLMNSREKEVIKRIRLINPNLKVREDKTDYDFFVKARCRYITPLVLVGGAFKKISEIDRNLKKRIDIFKKEHARGRYIKIIWS